MLRYYQIIRKMLKTSQNQKCTFANLNDLLFLKNFSGVRAQQLQTIGSKKKYLLFDASCGDYARSVLFDCCK